MGLVDNLAFPKLNNPGDVMSETNSSEIVLNDPVRVLVWYDYI